MSKIQYVIIISFVHMMSQTNTAIVLLQQHIAPTGYKMRFEMKKMTMTYRRHHHTTHRGSELYLVCLEQKHCYH